METSSKPILGKPRIPAWRQFHVLPGNSPNGLAGHGHSILSWSCRGFSCQYRILMDGYDAFEVPIVDSIVVCILWLERRSFSEKVFYRGIPSVDRIFSTGNEEFAAVVAICKGLCYCGLVYADNNRFFSQHLFNIREIRLLAAIGRLKEHIGLHLSRRHSGDDPAVLCAADLKGLIEKPALQGLFDRRLVYQERYVLAFEAFNTSSSVGSSPWEDKTAYALHCASSMLIVITGLAIAPLATRTLPVSWSQWTHPACLSYRQIMNFHNPPWARGIRGWVAGALESFRVLPVSMWKLKRMASFR